MDDIYDKIKEVLANYPDGIHGNALVLECKDFISRVTLFNRLNDLERDSEVFHTPQEPRRGQKKLYRLTDSYIKFDKELKKLDRQGDMILDLIYMLHYCLEKGYIKDEIFLFDPDKSIFEQEDRGNIQVVEFYKSLFDQYGVLFNMASNLGLSFPEKNRKKFYEHAFKIFKNTCSKDISVKNDYPVATNISYALRRPNIFGIIAKHHDDYLDWLEKNDDKDYRRIYDFKIKSIKETDELLRDIAEKEAQRHSRESKTSR